MAGFARSRYALKLGVRKLGAMCGVGVLVLLVGVGDAAGSVPTGIIVRTAKVSYEPSAAAPQRVLIEGVFALIKDPKTNTYAYPLAGSMYFECPAGKEKTCKLEWADIAKISGAKMCSMFGAVDKPTGKVWASGVKPTAADPYPIAMGVLNTPHALGICAKLVAPPAPDAGVADAAAVADSGSPGADAAPLADAAPAADAGAAVDTSVVRKDSGAVGGEGGDDGCSLAGSRGLGAPALLPLLLLGLALACRGRGGR